MTLHIKIQPLKNNFFKFHYAGLTSVDAFAIVNSVYCKPLCIAYRYLTGLGNRSVLCACYLYYILLLLFDLQLGYIFATINVCPCRLFRNYSVKSQLLAVVGKNDFQKEPFLISLQWSSHSRWNDQKRAIPRILTMEF